MAESFPQMKPRDVVNPSATILGLIVTALGILVALAGESKQVIVKNFAFLFIVIVVLFVLAVMFTAFSSLVRKIVLWKCALLLYVAGWAFLGTILIFVLVGYAYGIEALQLQFPEFNLDLVSVVASLVGLIFGLASAIYWYKKELTYRKRVLEMSKKITTTSKELDEATAQLKFESIDMRNSLLILRSDIKRELQEIAEATMTPIARPYQYQIRKLVTTLKLREILSADLAYSILFVYNFSSRVVHGETVSDKDAALVRELGTKALINLRKIAKKHESR